MALSRPIPQFAHRCTVRLILDGDMETNTLEIPKSLPAFADDICGIVPQFGGKCFDITLKTAGAAAKLALAPIRKRAGQERRKCIDGNKTGVKMKSLQHGVFPSGHPSKY